MSNSSASEQPAEGLTAEQAQSNEPASDAAPMAEPAGSQAAAGTPQRAPAQEGSMQTPQRMDSASAFSVFMSPLVKGAGAAPRCPCFDSCVLMCRHRQVSLLCT